MEFKIPPVEFLASAYVIALILTLVSALVFRERIRINGMPSWILYTVVAPAPVLGAVTLAGILQMPTNASLYSVSVACLLGIFFVHWLMPALLPDFQTENFSVSCVLAFLLGVSVFIAGTATGAFPAGMFGHQEDAFGKTKTEWQDGTRF